MEPLTEITDNIVLITDEFLAVYLTSYGNVTAFIAAKATDDQRYYAFVDSVNLREKIAEYDNKNAFVDVKTFRECLFNNDCELESSNL